MFFVAPHQGKFAVVQPGELSYPILVSVHDTESEAEMEAETLNLRVGNDYGRDSVPPSMNELLDALS